MGETGRQEKRRGKERGKSSVQEKERGPERK